MNKTEGLKAISCYALKTYPVSLSVENAYKWKYDVYFGQDSSGALYLTIQPPTAPDFFGRIVAGKLFCIR
jgi:hypothetical protein